MSSFSGKRALITGGLGFLGSNLALRLVELGAQVTVADAMIPEYGGNIFNLHPYEDQILVNYSDIRDPHSMNYLVRNQDFVFHMAGQVDHILSLKDPFPDIDINVKGTAVLLEACKHYAPEARIIHAGTRGQYGAAASLPVREDAPTHPKGIYEVTRLAAEKMMQVYHEVHGLRVILLRISNVFGERAQMRHPRYGVVNWFVRQALDDDTIQVFGDGQIKRDFLYQADCVDAMLACAAAESCFGEIINVGVNTPTTFVELATTLIEVAGSGRWQFAPFSPERKAQEPGDFYSDISKIKRLTGWQPTTPLAEGLRRTVDYYRLYRNHYW